MRNPWGARDAPEGPGKEKLLEVLQQIPRAVKTQMEPLQEQEQLPRESLESCTWPGGSAAPGTEEEEEDGGSQAELLHVQRLPEGLESTNSPVKQQRVSVGTPGPHSKIQQGAVRDSKGIPAGCPSPWGSDGDAPREGMKQLWELLCWPQLCPATSCSCHRGWAAGKSDQPCSRRRDWVSGGAWWVWTALELLVDYLPSSTCCQPK